MVKGPLVVFPTKYLLVPSDTVILLLDLACSVAVGHLDRCLQLQFLQLLLDWDMMLEYTRFPGLYRGCLVQ